MLDKIKQIGLHGVIYAVGSIAQSAVSFFLIPVFTKHFTTEIFGTFSFIDLFSLVIGSVFYLGITSALPRSYFDYECSEKRKGVFSTGFSLIMMGALAQVLLVYLFKSTLSQLIFKTPEYADHLFYISISSALNFLNQYFYSFARLLRKSVQVSLLSIFGMILNFSTTYYLLVYKEYELWAPIYSRLGTFLLILIFFLIIYREHFRVIFDRSEAKLMLKYGLPTVLSSLAGMSIDWSDRFFINEFLTISDVGIYSLGYKLGSVINIVLIAPFIQIWNPMMVEYRKKEGVKELFSTITLSYFVLGTYLCTALSAFIMLAGPHIVKGDSFLPALKFAPIIGLGILINGSVNIFCAGLIFERKVGYIAKSYNILCIINITLNFFLVKNFGVWGAVGSSVLTYCIGPTMIWHYGKRYFSFNIEWRKIITALCLSGFANLALINLYNIQSLKESAIFFILILVGLGAAYFIFLLSKKEKDEVFKFIKSRI